MWVHCSVYVAALFLALILSFALMLGKRFTLKWEIWSGICEAVPKKSLYVHHSSSEEEECESVKLSFCFFNKSIKGVWYFEICKCIKYHWLGNFGFVCLFVFYGEKTFIFACFVGEFGKLTFFWYCFVKCLYLSKLFVTHFAVINNLLYNSVSGHLCVSVDFIIYLFY